MTFSFIRPFSFLRNKDFMDNIGCLGGRSIRDHKYIDKMTHALETDWYMFQRM